MTLREYLDSTEITREAFARRVGIHRVTLQHYLAGRSTPNSKTCLAIIRESGGRITLQELVED